MRKGLKDDKSKPRTASMITGLKQLGYLGRIQADQKSKNPHTASTGTDTKLKVKSSKSKNIFRLSVRIESQKNNTRINQCRNCQEYGHGQTMYKAPPKCVKCGEGHTSVQKRLQESLDNSNTLREEHFGYRWLDIKCSR